MKECIINRVEEAKVRYNDMVFAENTNQMAIDILNKKQKSLDEISGEMKRHKEGEEREIQVDSTNKQGTAELEGGLAEETGKLEQERRSSQQL